MREEIADGLSNMERFAEKNIEEGIGFARTRREELGNRVRNVEKLIASRGNVLGETDVEHSVATVGGVVDKAEIEAVQIVRDALAGAHGFQDLYSTGPAVVPA